MMAADPLSLTFAALAHPARRAILARLSLGQTSVQELARPLKLSGPAMTKHLKSLSFAQKFIKIFCEKPPSTTGIAGKQKKFVILS